MWKLWYWLRSPKKEAMEPSRNCIDFITREEGGFYAKPYRDQAGIPTIGIGSTMYDTGKRVQMSDPPITQQRGIELLNWELKNKVAAINGKLGNVALNQNQFDALVSFTYNVGVGWLSGSTLLRLVKQNPCDPAIRDAFAMWNKITVNGKKVVSVGLSKRRKKESDLYFRKVL